jgi:hypothetical protein
VVDDTDELAAHVVLGQGLEDLGGDEVGAGLGGRGLEAADQGKGAQWCRHADDPARDVTPAHP